MYIVDIISVTVLFNYIGKSQSIHRLFVKFIEVGWLCIFAAGGQRKPRPRGGRGQPPPNPQLFDDTSTQPPIMPNPYGAPPGPAGQPFQH